MVYGRSKTGKTTFASSFPKPILFLDIRDRGTESISDVEDVFVREVDDWDTLEEIYYALAEEDHEFETVVLDTVTQLQQLVMEKVAKSANNRLGDWGSMTQRQWGDVAAQMKHWLAMFRNLPMETVFLAQERTENAGDDGPADNTVIPEVGPSVTKSIKNAMCADADIIVSTFIRMCERTKEVKGEKKKVEELVHCLRTGADPVYTTGMRKPKNVTVPLYIPNPTYEDVIDIIKGE